MDSKPIIVEKLKQHWLVSLLLLCAAVASGTWKVANELLVLPRDLKIAQQKDQISTLKEEVQRLKAASSSPASAQNETSVVLPPTGVFEGTSLTTNDGRCSVRIIAVRGDLITLAVTLDSGAAKRFENQGVGGRVALDAGGSMYVIDLHLIRGNIVDLSVNKLRK